MKYNILSIDGVNKSDATQIGERLSAMLGLPCYQSDILLLAAMRGHTTANDLDRLQEITSSNLLHSIYTHPKEETFVNRTEDILRLENDIIHGLAERGPFILVGHGIQSTNDSTIEPFLVFTYSVWNKRTQRTVRQFGTQQFEYINKLKKYAGHMTLLNRAYFGNRAGDSSTYHMILDSGRLGIEHCAKAIVAAIE